MEPRTYVASTVQKSDTDLTVRAAHEVFIGFKSDPRVFRQRKKMVLIISKLQGALFQHAL